MSEIKTFHGQIKAAGPGTLVATFSRFDIPDWDGDVTLKSAIEEKGISARAIFCGCSRAICRESRR